MSQIPWWCKWASVPFTGWIKGPLFKGVFSFHNLLLPEKILLIKKKQNQTTTKTQTNKTTSPLNENVSSYICNFVSWFYVKGE